MIVIYVIGYFISVLISFKLMCKYTSSISTIEQYNNSSFDDKAFLWFMSIMGGVLLPACLVAFGPIFLVGFLFSKVFPRFLLKEKEPEPKQLGESKDYRSAPLLK